MIKNISEDLNLHYFWDVDVNKLDPEKSKRLIIERVFTLGTSKEIMLVINHYGKEQILDILTNLNFIDPKTLNFVSKLFDVPLNKFKCYTRRQH